MSISEMLNKLPASYISKDPDSDFGKRLAAFSEELEEARIVSEDLRDLQDYTKRFGRTLDLIGANLGQPRNALDDVRYRIALSTADRKRQAKGDIQSMNEVGDAIMGDLGSLYRIEELCYSGEALFLDASWNLNGDPPLSGSTKRPATIKAIFQGDADSLSAEPEFARAIDQIRAGGIRAIISYRFLILSGLWKNSDPSIFPLYIAVGNGAEPGGVLRPPEETDTGLQNELVREFTLVSHFIDEPDQFFCEIERLELVGMRINEVALFDSDENLLFLASFPGKEKDNLITYQFAVKDIREI